jgi:hypothetical protein
MPFVIVTDPLGIGNPITPTVWGKGSRLYYTGESDRTPKLEWAISSAVKFETMEAAETRLMLLCVWEPELIDHGHIVEHEEAWKQWHADLKTFEEKSGIIPDHQGGCF